MASWSSVGKAEAQDFLLYRRDVLKTPDEVLSEARKNHSIFKAHVVSGGLRPSVRHIGLSRFQFGDGEYAASVESMQRYIQEKAAKPEPLPQIQEPVPITRTLSRSTSSRNNPFRANVRTRHPPPTDSSAASAAAKAEPDGGGTDDNSVTPTCPSRQDACEATSQGQDGAATAVEVDAHAAAVEVDMQFAATTAALTPSREGFISASGTDPAAMGGGASTADRSCTRPASRRSTAHSFKSLPCSASLTPRAPRPSSPVPSGGGFADEVVGGTGDFRGNWIGCGPGGDDTGNACGGSGRDEVEYDVSDDEAGGGGRLKRRITSPANAVFGGFHSTLPAPRLHSGTLREPEFVAGSPSGPGTVSRRSSAQYAFTAVNGAGGFPPDSPTGRVDRLLSDLRRLKGMKSSGSGSSSPRGGGGGGGGGGGTASASSGAARGGGGSNSVSGRASSGGSLRFDSSREAFAARGRSVTLMSFSTTDEDGPRGQSDAAAGLAALPASSEAADRAFHHQRHQKTQHRFQRAAASQPQVHLQLQPPPSFQSAPPAVPSASSAAPSARPGASAPASAAAAQQGLLVSSAAAAALHPSPHGGGAATSPLSLSNRSVHSLDDDRSAAASAHPTPHSPFSSQGSAAAAVAAAAAGKSPTPPRAPPLTAAAAAPAPAAAVQHQPGPLAGGAAPPGSGGRVGSRKLLPETEAAAQTALSGWSSRNGSGRSEGGRHGKTVGSFFANLLSAAGSPMRPRGPVTPV